MVIIGMNILITNILSYHIRKDGRNLFIFKQKYVIKI